MKEEIIRCDKCGAIIQRGAGIIDTYLDHDHPLVESWMKHGTKIYLRLDASLSVVSKVECGWSIKQDLCDACFNVLIKEIIESS